MYLLPRMLLLLLLSAGTSLAVNTNWLTGIVAALQREYKITAPSDRPGQDRRKSQFCVAVNIPKGQEPDTLMNQVPQNDRYSQRLQEELDSERLHVGTAMVLAVPAGAKHAEVSVLQNLNQLMRNARGNVLVIYSFLSPCSKCTDPTNKFSIIKLIKNKVLNHWDEYAFVFTGLFNKPAYSMEGESGTRDKDELAQSLTNLGDSGFGLRNIFRCFEPQTEFQCYSCSSGQQVANVCIDDNVQPQEGGSRSSRSSDRNRRRSSNRSRSSSSNKDRGRKRRRYRTASESSSGSDRSRNWDRSNRRRSSSGG
ncbi:uncharacterized protein LOC111571222 [Amphiprion ocellaris]|uniref:uncharacterized protein LOC111571222 n=1 Tax=Amphiprion ocellaris TaxID=80972 RepID=UPI0024111554|nr:uncharacterized protein LOC111571222 [Amphiprion ocellaris]